MNLEVFYKASTDQICLIVFIYILFTIHAYTQIYRKLIIFRSLEKNFEAVVLRAHGGAFIKLYSTL